MSQSVTLDEAGMATLIGRMARGLAATPTGRRWVVGIAGAPGAGKSTLAARLAARWNASDRADSPRQGRAAVVPMDGFHYTNARLTELGLRGEKGSERTFDAPGYAALLARIRNGERVTFPLYDRALHEPVLSDAAGQQLGPDDRVIVTEGNYLLLPNGHWPAARACMDETWFLATDPSTAQKWIVDRHVRGGRSLSDAIAQYQRIDHPNAIQITEYADRADVRLHRP